jgi:hypothetical protein
MEVSRLFSGSDRFVLEEATAVPCRMEYLMTANMYRDMTAESRSSVTRRDGHC